MFVRNITFRLKPNMAADYNRTLQNEILPLLRKEKGFKDEIALCNPDSPDAIAISLWENKVDAETYNTNVYPNVVKILERMIDGKPTVKTFEVVTSTLHTLLIASSNREDAVNPVSPSVLARIEKRPGTICTPPVIVCPTDRV
jgi:hypothetical protein